MIIKEYKKSVTRRKAAKIFKFKFEKYFLTLLLISVALISLNNIKLYNHTLRYKIKNIQNSIFSEIEDAFSSNLGKKQPKCNVYFQNATETYFNISGTFYPKFIPLYQNKTLNFDCLQQDNKSKVILLWTKWFKKYKFGYYQNGLYFLPFEANPCPVSNCKFTFNKNRLGESDMIIFHMRDILEPLPSFRYAHQRWVFMLYESPANSGKFTKFNGKFNTSATYKKSSNYTSIYYSDSGLVWEENEQYDIKRNFSASKSEFAAAIISNCGTKNKRLEIIKKLQNYFPLDVFGKCGKKCPIAYKNGTYVPCKENIGNQYKFIFAFENSLCTDYISEKFFLMLRYDIVPVVYGSGNYDYYVPKEAYINVQDFATIPKLAEYLLYLDKNSTAYNEYFKWKRFIKFRAHPNFTPFCEMCIQLNMQQFEPMRQSIIENFQEFWNPRKDCRIVKFGKNSKLITVG